MSDLPYRIHPLSLVLGPIAILRGWIVPLVIAFVLGRSSGPGGFPGVGSGFGFVVVGALVTVAGQLVQLLRMRWSVDADSFQLRSGVLQVETRSVPLERIHNVDIEQPLLPRLLDLAEVRVETAGASGADVRLRYVSLAHARWLRSVLVEDRHPPDGAVGDRAGADRPGDHRAAGGRDVEGSLLVETTTRELLIAGATANRIGALAVAAAAVAGWAWELGFDPRDVAEQAEPFLMFGLENPVILVLVVLIPAVLVGWAVSIVETVLRYHGFRLLDRGAEVRREHGLLSLSSGTVPLSRVQAVRVDRPLLRRLAGYATVLADTAGSVAAGTEGGTGVVAPIVGEQRVGELVARMTGEDAWREGRLHPVSRHAIRRAAIRVAVPALLAAAGTAFLDPRPAVALALAGPLAGVVWARLRYAALGYRVDDRLLVARSGVLTRHTWIVPVRKVQAVAVSRTFFQRRLGIATLSVDTAGPGNHRIRVIDLEEELARRIADALSHGSALAAVGSDGV